MSINIIICGDNMKAESSVKIIVVALNKPPVWITVPDVSFKQGTAGSFDLSPFVSDPQGVPMTLSVASGSLPAGVTLQGMSLVYDGVGTAATDTVSIAADDGLAP